ncbi:putative GMC oxidoreductase [Daldinia bambusicola]|nr:putative GMC oxidoreductase [Daldinia bambusicola]
MASTTFDYVIVGGGIAGLVLAARLSEDSETSILVIEAGEDQTSDSRVNIPSMWPTLLRGESAWNFETVPQQELQGRQISFPQGRLLGGSSALNGLCFSETTKANVDAWESLGNPGWDWASFSESMRKSFTLASGGTEVKGPIQLCIPEADTEWPSVWMKTLDTLRISPSGDPFNGEFTGGWVAPDTIDPLTKQRSYAANAYLEPARSRSNLTVWTKTEADKIIFDKSNGVVATGVQVVKDGETKIVEARKEVIIAAGAINSPRLLELSGIGDAKLLQSLGIDVVVDNPNVGENLQNHPMCTLSFEARKEPGFETVDALARQDGEAIAAAMEAYANNKKGPFSRSGANLLLQMQTPGMRSPEDAAKVLELLRTGADAKNSHGDKGESPKSFAQFHANFLKDILTSPNEATATYFAAPVFAGYSGDGWMVPPPEGQENYFTLALILAHPLSRGSVHVTRASRDPSAVAIDPKYLSHPVDVELMARYLQFAEEIAATEPLASHLNLGGKRNPSAPAAAAAGSRSFADLDVAKEYLYKTAVGAYHYTGSCSMMSRELGGVVDAQLRVYGCRNLRVCDASIIPITPRTNTQGTVYAVAEHAAQIIRTGS